MSDSRTASPRKSADSAMASAAEDSTRLDREQWDRELDFFISPKCRNKRYRIGNLRGKPHGHRPMERYTLDL
jgi:hypothetical protein